MWFWRLCQRLNLKQEIDFRSMVSVGLFSFRKLIVLTVLRSDWFSSFGSIAVDVSVSFWTVCSSFGLMHHFPLNVSSQNCFLGSSQKIRSMTIGDNWQMPRESSKRSIVICFVPLFSNLRYSLVMFFNFSKSSTWFKKLTFFWSPRPLFVVPIASWPTELIGLEFSYSYLGQSWYLWDVSLQM